MSEFTESRIEDIAEIHTGRSLSRDERFWGGDIPRAKSQDLDSSFISDTEEHITEEAKKEIEAAYCPEGTVVLSTRGNIGSISMLEESMFISQDLKGLFVDPEEVVPEYLLYSLESKRDRLKELSSGSSVKSLTNKELGKVKIELPPLEIQEKIVDKIRQVEKSRNRTENHYNKISEVKTEAMMKLFREGFEESPTRKEPVYGDIPESWDLKPLGDVARIKMGQSPDTNKLTEEEEPNFVQNGSDLGLRNPEPTRRLEDANITADENDLLTLVRGSEVGKTNVADRKYAVGRGIARIETDDLVTEFLHYYLNFRTDRIEQLSGSGTTTWITKKDLQKLKVPVPPKSEQENIVETLRTIDEVMGTDKELIEKSGQMKESLLSKFLNSPNNYEGETV